MNKPIITPNNFKRYIFVKFVSNVVLWPKLYFDHFGVSSTDVTYHGLSRLRNKTFSMGLVSLYSI